MSEELVLCPRCGSRANGPVTSGNLMFYWCDNDSCRNVWSTGFRSPIHHRLPVERGHIISFLRNERREASRTTEEIGRGILVDERRSKDGLSKIARIKAVISRETTLRPYDAIYYGNSLGVILEASENGMSLIFDSSRQLPEEGALVLAEPLILYDSALSIVQKRAMERGEYLARFVDLGFECQQEESKASKVGDINSSYNLDPEKVEIVHEVISMPDFDYRVIEGPPGTGKTTVTAAIALEMAKMGKNVLITSHTNVAVDNALERILDFNPDLGDEIARIGHPAKVSERVKPLIDRQLPDESREEWLTRLLEEKRIIGMTIAKLAVLDYAYNLQAISERLGKWPSFDLMLMDESSMIPLGIAIIALYYSKKWVIIGDTRQLPPIIRTRHRYPGAWSIMEIASAYDRGRVRMLKKQRRGNAAIFDVISRVFYGGALINDDKVAGEKLRLSSFEADPWIKEVLNPDEILSWVQIRDGVMEWYRVRRGRIESASGANISEAAAVLGIYKKLIESGMRSNDIAIITTYRAQANLIRESIRRVVGENPIVAAMYHGIREE
jgi:DNA replication ATP-dependent helicase Dna2